MNETAKRRMTGVELIKAERERQISSLGRTFEHDDEHTDGELADAAVAFIWNDPDPWPFAEQYEPGPIEDRKRRLIKAGALIAAEIDRLQRD